jgi:hypothetical protein
LELPKAAVCRAGWRGNVWGLLILLHLAGVEVVLQQEALQKELHKIFEKDPMRAPCHNADMLLLLPVVFSSPAGQAYLLEHPELLQEAARMVASYSTPPYFNSCNEISNVVVGVLYDGARHSDPLMTTEASAAAAAFIAEQPALTVAVLAAALEVLAMDDESGPVGEVSRLVEGMLRVLPVRQALVSVEGDKVGLLDMVLARCGDDDDDLPDVDGLALLGKPEEPLTAELVAAVTKRLHSKDVHS